MRNLTVFQGSGPGCIEEPTFFAPRKCRYCYINRSRCSLKLDNRFAVPSSRPHSQIVITVQPSFCRLALFRASLIKFASSLRSQYSRFEDGRLELGHSPIRINPLSEVNLLLVVDSLYGTLLLTGLAVHPSGDVRLASIAFLQQGLSFSFYIPMSESGYCYETKQKICIRQSSTHRFSAYTFTTFYLRDHCCQLWCWNKYE